MVRRKMARSSYIQSKLNKQPVRIYGHDISKMVNCSSCTKFKTGNCDKFTVITERYGFLKLFKNEILIEASSCTEGELDIGYIRENYDKYGKLLKAIQLHI